MTSIIYEKSTLDACKLTESATSQTQPKPFGWVDKFILTDKEINAIAAPKWIIANLIISGHVILIPAEPNAGKTTIFFYLAGEMVKKGSTVYYVNTDISGGDAKPLALDARGSGINLLLPDMKVGLSMNSVIDKLVELSNSDESFSDTVFIFDTLKKMLNVLSKDAAKRFFQLIRKLSAKGMTIILLAHTNKYFDKEGNPIYEGTGDMRSDVDELIYLIPQKHDDGSMTVTTKPDKVRGAFEPITFKITTARGVTLESEVVDTLQANIIEQEFKKDEVNVAHILTAIKSGSKTQKDIIDYCKNSSIGERVVKATLVKYSDESSNALPKQWKKEKGERNSLVFSLVA